MSRIGKKPIPIPEGVTVAVDGALITVSGPKGTLRRTLPPVIEIAVQDGKVLLSPRDASRQASALWGLARSLVANMVAGAATDFEKKLEFEGIGYRAALEGKTLVMQLGFSHPVRYDPPPGVEMRVERNTIMVSGADKEAVGLAAAQIRALKPPEPYKGKGIRYAGEIIRRKAGKKAIASA